MRTFQVVLFSILSQPKLEVVNRTLVVYHLHGQTGRFTVWVNSSQSSLGRIQDFFRRGYRGVARGGGGGPGVPVTPPW